MCCAYPLGPMGVVLWCIHNICMANEKTDTLANEGTLKEKPFAAPHMHLAHATPYWLARCPTATHNGAIRNIHKFVMEAHDNREVIIAQNKFHT